MISMISSKITLVRFLLLISEMIILIITVELEMKLTLQLLLIL